MTNCEQVLAVIDRVVEGTLDDVTRALRKRRWVPEFRFINHYHDARGYIAAAAQNSMMKSRSATLSILLADTSGKPKSSAVK